MYHCIKKKTNLFFYNMEHVAHATNTLDTKEC
jgi:hypothetical protein